LSRKYTDPASAGFLLMAGASGIPGEIAVARGAEDHAGHADQQCAHNPYPNARDGVASGVILSN